MPIVADAASALDEVPSASGVGQLVAADKSLVLGATANLRRWAASHLGLGKPAPAGRRPRTNLAGIATAVGWVEIDGPFRQRLVYERLLAPLVPLSARRDLKPPVFVELDEGERFPRVSVRSGEAGSSAFGPFASRGAAEQARAAVHRRFALRSCDSTFEPAPELPLGLGCVYAQVRSCSAPCLLRVSEDDYRALAGRAAAWLADPAARGEAEVDLPSIVAASEASRALVVDAGRATVGLVPVRAGRVLDAAALAVEPGQLDDAVGRLDWPRAEGPADWPWLAAWLRSPKVRACYLIVHEDETPARLLARVRAALGSRFGGKLGSARGEP